MSLKALHIVFVTASVTLAVFLAGWCFNSYFSPRGTQADLIWGSTSVAAVIGLLWYGRYFLKKLKHISYL